MHLVKSYSWCICTYCWGQQSLENPPPILLLWLISTTYLYQLCVDLAKLSWQKYILQSTKEPSFPKCQNKALFLLPLPPRHEVPKCEKSCLHCCVKQEVKDRSSNREAGPHQKNCTSKTRMHQHAKMVQSHSCQHRFRPVSLPN